MKRPAALLLLAALPVEAGVYKCVVEGQTVFSQIPCGNDARRMDILPGPVPPPRDSGAAVESFADDPLLLEYRARQKAMVEAQGAAAAAHEAERAERRRVKDAVKDGRIVAGMGPDDVKRVLGEPQEIKRARSASSASETWYYRKRAKTTRYVRFRDGRVVYYSGD